LLLPNCKFPEKLIKIGRDQQTKFPINNRRPSLLHSNSSYLQKVLFLLREYYQFTDNFRVTPLVFATTVLGICCTLLRLETRRSHSTLRYQISVHSLHSNTERSHHASQNHNLNLHFGFVWQIGQCRADSRI
jgi:hypothetical protein